MKIATKITAVAAGALTATALTGCSFFGSSVAAEDVEESIAAELESQLGSEMTVDCPEDLEAEEGATMHCDLPDDPEGNQIEVVVDSVDGDTVNYSFRLAPADGGEDTE